MSKVTSFEDPTCPCKGDVFVLNYTDANGSRTIAASLDKNKLKKRLVKEVCSEMENILEREMIAEEVELLAPTFCTSEMFRYEEVFDSDDSDGDSDSNVKDAGSCDGSDDSDDSDNYSDDDSSDDESSDDANFEFQGESFEIYIQGLKITKKNGNITSFWAENADDDDDDDD